MSWKSRRQMVYIDLGRNFQKKGAWVNQAHHRLLFIPKNGTAN